MAAMFAGMASGMFGGLAQYYQMQEMYQQQMDMQNNNWDRKTAYGSYMAGLQNYYTQDNMLLQNKLNGLATPSSIMRQHGTTGGTVSSSTPSMTTNGIPEHVMAWAQNYQANKMSVTPPDYSKEDPLKPKIDVADNSNLSEFDIKSFQDANKAGDIDVSPVSEAAPLVSIEPFEKQKIAKPSGNSSFTTGTNVSDPTPSSSSAEDDHGSRVSYNA